MKTLPIIKDVRSTYEEIIENGCIMQMGDFLILVNQANAFVHIKNYDEPEKELSFINYDKLAKWLNDPTYAEEEY